MEPVLTPADYDERVTHCLLCGSPELRPFDEDLRGNCIESCRSCGVLFMNPQYTDENRERFYEGYISFHIRPNSKNQVPMRKLHWVGEEGKRRCLELIGQFVEPGRLLSVGTGAGAEIGMAQELGWEVEGYDIDPPTTLEVARRFGVKMHSGAFEALDLPLESFDAVFMDQVIEHLKSPGDYLRKIRSVLRPGGILFLGMPNIGSWSNRLKTFIGRMRLRKKHGKHYASKHHIFFFTPMAMRKVLEGFYGFDVLCMRGSLKPQRNPVTPFLSRWLPNADSGFIAIARKRAQ